MKAYLKCDYCNQDIQPDPITGWAGGNNGWPLEKSGAACETVCNVCNDLVIMERLRRATGEDMMDAIKDSVQGVDGARYGRDDD